MAPWLKAGLIGGAVLAVLSLFGLIPCVGCITWLVGLLVYFGIGMLAAYWMPGGRQAGPAAGQGAMAAGLAALIGGVVNAIVLTAQAAIVGSAQILSQLPPELLQQLEQSGLDQQWLDASAGPVGAVVGGSLCCVGGVVLAAILGALGGVVFAAAKPD